MTEDQIASDAAASAEDGEEPDELDQQLSELSREELEQHYRDLVQIYKDSGMEYRSMSKDYLEKSRELNAIRRGAILRMIFDTLRVTLDERYQLDLVSTNYNNFSHIPFDEISHILIKQQDPSQRWKLILE